VCGSARGRARAVVRPCFVFWRREREKARRRARRAAPVVPAVPPRRTQRHVRRAHTPCEQAWRDTRQSRRPRGITLGSRETRKTQTHAKAQKQRCLPVPDVLSRTAPASASESDSRSPSSYRISTSACGGGGAGCGGDVSKTFRALVRRQTTRTKRASASRRSRARTRAARATRHTRLQLAHDDAAVPGLLRGPPHPQARASGRAADGETPSERARHAGVRLPRSAAPRSTAPAAAAPRQAVPRAGGARAQPLA
jgi:hypothetical protein